ncbi:MAG: alpha-amylase family glycosyl hydrolase [Sediminibacterium sp.]|nr:alpha-amylase family glycosyl hydrolase [Sediminibacterium sp.]
MLLNAQSIATYPTNWFINMKLNKIQILLQSKTTKFADNPIVSINYDGVELKKVHHFKNKLYLAIDIVISNTAKPGIIPIRINERNYKHTVSFELKPRREGKGTQFAQGVNSDDFIYLLMPDRFANGDVTNDKVVGYRDQSLNRDSMYLRHGGDFKGIINHIDYLQKLGVTTLWMTPVIENNMPNRTEHGYAFTNHYAIDKRLGGDEAYLQLSIELHKKGMKLIQDAVYNHVGSYHFLVLNPPDENWLHQWKSFTQTNFREQPAFDPHGSKKDLDLMQNGWFVKEMPDLNHQNKFVENFLIQHALWSIETFGIDGWRIDTYIYNDLDFMNRLNTALSSEYPKITYFGECMVNSTVNQAYFVENNLNTSFKSNLQAPVDFQTLFNGIQPALTEENSWNGGVSKLYNTLSNDFLYKDPMRNVNLLDNHDLSRFFSIVKENVAKQKIGIAWLLTCRGIPQIYYGTEVLMKGYSNPDGLVRLDFPGGWEGDKKNAFTETGLTIEEKSTLQYTQTIANFRKKSTALKKGKLMQYLPKDGVYVYFRYDKNQTIMCVMNNTNQSKEVHFSDFYEMTNSFKNGVDIVSNQIIQPNFSINAETLLVIELKK